MQGQRLKSQKCKPTHPGTLCAHYNGMSVGRRKTQCVKVELMALECRVPCPGMPAQNHTPLRSGLNKPLEELIVCACDEGV